eukprot:TRINITY_DN84346_c0_g1_i1.p2 TRINITY_DN84346_c0_g1~~TRINITY_DN84346_c0_g1_i1.p2  ORF type:complete len:176 (-),score=27.83 TRINITY_DN84346_c0_g1_i1:58-585(-)
MKVFIALLIIAAAYAEVNININNDVSSQQCANNGKDKAWHDAVKDFFFCMDMGRGWEACKRYCTEDAVYYDPEAFPDMHTLSAWTDWMTGFVKSFPDADPELKYFTVDNDHRVAIIYAIYHTGLHSVAVEGFPPPTGKGSSLEYSYVFNVNGNGKVTKVTKVWDAGNALGALGWA